MGILVDEDDRRNGDDGCEGSAIESPTPAEVAEEGGGVHGVSL